MLTLLKVLQYWSSILQGHFPNLIPFQAQRHSNLRDEQAGYAWKMLRIYVLKVIKSYLGHDKVIGLGQSPALFAYSLLQMCRNVSSRARISTHKTVDITE